MAMFDRYDVDRSGALELTEVGYALHDLNVMDGVLTSDVAALFKEYDEDGNGDLDFHEFEKLVARINAQRGTATKKKFIVEVPEGVASSGAAAALKARFEEYATEKALGMKRVHRADEDEAPDHVHRQRVYHFKLQLVLAAERQFRKRLLHELVELVYAIVRFFVGVPILRDLPKNVFYILWSRRQAFANVEEFLLANFVDGDNDF